jgi:hypothetical protein
MVALGDVFEIKGLKRAQIPSTHAKIATSIHDQPIIATAMAVK